MGIVICKLPKAGLGNQLFPLMKAYTFAHLNQLPVIVTNYNQLKLGPWLRGEKSKRNYNGFFIFQKSIFSGQLDKWNLKKYKKNVYEIEPGVKHLENINSVGHSYLFYAMPHYENYFGGLKENRRLVIELFWKIINPGIINNLNALETPCIGIHIRMGDFRKLKQGEEFSKVGCVRTPEHYYIDIIKGIRKIHGSVLPVSVFTDGHRKELPELFSLENIQMIEGNTDLLDMLLLSRSKIIVTAASSTFSYWAAFISDTVVIMHPDHLHQPLRPDNVNELSYEGPFDVKNEQLMRQIHAIKND